MLKNIEKLNSYKGQIQWKAYKDREIEDERTDKQSEAELGSKLKERQKVISCN